ncbi:hypothetical protein A1Q1_04194 [Trichosporon asahii var. asahii CBS 2479]|uniref:Uncharacterized protein n=1 Tax=Trichosporon asahii var. asahii (strain ATCC 90039 / CBS 2479 / JCM 2466 / KCTC 7840 / NBRC 103889/ NCYC 2677 / UAMH 7654) TaxID=1186058 RepID=J5SQE5_TRIAS|nr:hypothetical protein A1Q1_04194 [Trichosporon asahii var. asahii CBS 2479]EJT46951.1 hypothetical protein A1Q1_04194 [Trichosporon asahii var. asahii CBS 2479]
MVSFKFLVLLPAVAATFIHFPDKGDPCADKTRTVTTTIKTATSTSTSICSTPSKCTSTQTRYSCPTTTVPCSKTSTCTNQAKQCTYTSTSTCKAVAVKTTCRPWRQARADEIPEEMTNAERIKLGLPLRSVSDERRWFHKPPTGPSCKPTTTTVTKTSTCFTPAVTRSYTHYCLYKTVTTVPDPTIGTVTVTDRKCPTTTITNTPACWLPTVTTIYTATTTRTIGFC